ncbi:MAG: ribose-phosphate diphosphokinase, partial [Geminicoccales bacterium]
LLQERGASPIYAAATHGIFAQDGLELIDRSPIDKVLVTDTLPLPRNGPTAKIEVVSVAPLLAEAITRIHKDLSISALFT